MDRETRTIILPVSNKEVVIKSYLTGREQRQIQNAYFTEKLQVGSTAQFSLGADTLNRGQEAGWLAVIVTVDGKNDDIINRVLDLRVEDYSYLVEQVNKIASPVLSDEKKTS